MMKKDYRKAAAILLVVLLCIPGFSPAQFKSDFEHQPSSAQGLLKPNASIGNFFGLLDADNFSMHHTLGMNYMSSNEGGLSVASYTNSMFFKLADPLTARFDVTLMGSPFGSYAGYQQNDFSKVFISRAELNYRPSDNTLIRLEYNQLPFGRYSYYDSFAPSPFMLGDH